MPVANHTKIASVATDLFAAPSAVELAETVEGSALNESKQVVAIDPDTDHDELEEPGGLRDVEGFPDSWEGPRDGDDELHDVVREAEYFPPTDLADDQEPPRDRAAAVPAWSPPPAIVRTPQPVQSVVPWIHALGDPERVPPSVVAARASEILAMGQVRPCRGRWLDAGHVEIVSGLLEYLAVKSIAERGGEPWFLLVDVEPMTDQRAFQIAYADAVEGAPLSPLDHARFAQAAIKEAFKTQREMAAALGINESNLTRLLFVAKCADAVADVVTDPWSISRAKAERFMRLLNDPKVRRPLRAFIKEAEPQTAKAFFAAVSARFAPPPAAKPGEVVVANDEGEPLGRVGRKSSGTVILTLDKVAGAIELPTLIRFVEAALGQLRNAAA